MSNNCGPYEHLCSPKITFSSGVIASYFFSFLKDHPVLPITLDCIAVVSPREMSVVRVATNILLSKTKIWLNKVCRLKQVYLLFYV